MSKKKDVAIGFQSSLQTGVECSLVSQYVFIEHHLGVTPLGSWGYVIKQ